MSDARIRSSARRLRAGVIIAFLILVTVIACARLGLPLGGAHMRLETKSGEAFAGLRAGDGTLVLMAVALFHLTEGLRGLANGAGFFSATVIRRFRLFAGWLLIMALYSFLAPTIGALAKSMAGGRHLALFIVDIRDLMLVAITLLLFLLTRLLERAGEIEQENSEIV
jgi:hypothetical protein